MSNDPSSYYERRLMREIETIDHRIKELSEEKLALRRQLIKARWENTAIKDVSRKNSGNRVMVEARVLDALKATKHSMSTAKLYPEALKANFELKENTFRTYLHRMKDKGLIVSVGRALWTLSKSTTSGL